MTETSIIKFDPGEPPNNLTRAQAQELGILPAVTADGTPDIFSDTGTSVSGFSLASRQVAELLKHVD